MPPTSQPAPATGADKRPDKRRENIVAYVTRHGTARVEDLARHFEVSPMTVHRDLDHLAAENLLERVRGGARSVSPSMSELGVGQRRQLHRDVKSGLCALAAELVEDGAVVSVDDSTTLESLVTLLPQRSPSALITHSLAAMSLHRQRTGAGNIRLIGCGGQYIPETDSFLGAVTSEQLRRLSADVVFVSTTAVRPSAGGGPAIFHPDTEAAETKRALLDTAPVKVLVVDSTKFGAPGVFKIADVTEFDHVVVDTEISDADRALLENTGATLHVLGEIEGDN